MQSIELRIGEPEVLLQAGGQFQLIRRRQTLEQILQNEQPAEGL